MAFTLEDIENVPLKPEEMRKHLLDRGLIPPPAPIAPAIPPATVGPLSAVAPPEPTVKPMARPVIPEAIAPGAAAPNDLHPLDLGGGVPGGPSGPLSIAPMTPPDLTHKEKMALPVTSPGAPDVGSAEYTRNLLARAEEQRMHPWGTPENHPGFLGKLGHIAAKVGNIAGDIVAPGVMAAIPGTDLGRMAEESSLKRELTGRTAAEAEGKLRGTQQQEAEARLSKLQNEQELIKDAEGNVTGYKDPTGKLHSLEGAPQEIQDIADATRAKTAPKFEKDLQGNIIQLTTDKDGKTKSEVVYQGKPAQKLETKTLVGADGHAHEVIVDMAATDEKGRPGKIVNDLGRAKEEKPASSAADIRGEEPVIGYDKDGRQTLMSRAEAKEKGLTHIIKATTKDRDDAEQNTSVLNDMGAKTRNLLSSSKGIDGESVYQRTLIQTALRGHQDDYSTRIALSMMDKPSKEFTMDVFSLREAALALPKQLTGGSRVSEIQAQALWNTIPGSSGDHDMRTSQLKKFDENLGRLWKKVPLVEGNAPERAFQQEMKAGAEKTGEKAPPREPKPGMKWQQSKKTGEYREVPAENK